VLLSFFVLGTTLSWLQAAGGLLICVALWLVNREMPARNRRERMNEAIAEGEA
jgi:drug/metabolite transporter (DMT)-like permease